MRQPLIAGNWKMHGDLAFAKSLTKAICYAELPESVEVVVFPSFLQIPAVMHEVKSAQGGHTIRVGSQNISAWTEGAYTGDVAGQIIRDAGCEMVLVGHSERRALFGETSEDLVQKILRASESGLTWILCVGETLSERESGQTQSVLSEQIGSVLATLNDQVLAQCVIAYEPVWAIGTGRTATPGQAQEAHEFIRSQVALKSPTLAERVRILYGGSVKPENSAELMAMPDIDGGLVGGASLNAESFIRIIKSVVA